MPLKDPIKSAEYKRIWGIKNRDRLRVKRRAYLREYYERNREKILERAKSRKIKTPQPSIKHKARCKLNKALKNKSIQKPVDCPKCGRSDRRIEAHHYNGYDMNHALDVLWLCSVCHRSLHLKD